MINWIITFTFIITKLWCKMNFFAHYPLKGYSLSWFSPALLNWCHHQPHQAAQLPSQSQHLFSMILWEKPTLTSQYFTSDVIMASKDLPLFGTPLVEATNCRFPIINQRAAPIIKLSRCIHFLLVCTRKIFSASKSSLAKNIDGFDFSCYFNIYFLLHINLYFHSITIYCHFVVLFINGNILKFFFNLYNNWTKSSAIIICKNYCMEFMATH